MALLERVLHTEFVPHLPPLVNQKKSTAERDKKNLSRAFAGYAVAMFCKITPKKAAQSVVDDFDDGGVDAVYFDSKTDTVVFVQAKLKISETFGQEEALSFCNGVRKFIGQDFAGMNAHVLNRQTEIEDSISNCSNIELIIAHVGSGISAHAKDAISNFLEDDSHGEERFASPFRDYGAKQVIDDLRDGKAYKRVDATLVLRPWSSETESRTTYFGFVPLRDLAKLYSDHGMALFVKNLRNPLGHKTDVAKAAYGTLETNPEDFVYLNNGVTALCTRILPKENRKAGKRLKLEGMSVINGAQTIASAAYFMEQNPGKDISRACVLITLIKADSDPSFGKAVTRARNHQNQVDVRDFAGLDDEQERLRRDLAVLGLHYAYKREEVDAKQDPDIFTIDEAACALALLQANPRYAVFLKQSPGELLDSKSDIYKQLFTPNITAFELVNSIRLFRYVQSRMVVEAKANSGRERLAYKHGGYALAFILFKRMRKVVQLASLVDIEKMEKALSPEFDTLRQTLWAQVEKHDIGPLSLFRSQAHAVPLIRDTMIEHYGLVSDPALPALSSKFAVGEMYPKALFDYLARMAPQIGI